MSSSPTMLHTNVAQVTLRSLLPDIDREFAKFYEAVQGDAGPNAADFDAAANVFLDQRGGVPSDVDAFFNNFTPLWTNILSQGRIASASTVWIWALRPVLSWETASGKRVHKGTAFYFAAMTAILAGDIDAGYLYAHRAFEEDRITHGHLAPATPSLSLVCMDPDNVHQAFRDWVMEKATFVNSALEHYRSAHGRSLDFFGLSAKLLQRTELGDATFLFSYSVARLRRLEALGSIPFSSGFGGQLGANLLFDITLVIDAVLRRANAPIWKFIDLAAALSTQAALDLTKPRLIKVNARFQGDFDGTVNACLDGALILDDGFNVRGLAASLALTYGCRNRGAHDVSSVGAIRNRFDEVRQALLDALFVAVEAWP
jgi:hypothetical protein